MQNIKIVLHQTKISENIGSVCRAIGNMGLGQLILVDKICEVNEKSEAMAVGCQDILNSRIEYSGWEDFLKAESGLKIAFSARLGKERESLQAEKLIRELYQASEALTKNDSPIYFIFGREDFGLSADDLLNFHHTCLLPVFGEYKSLNISQAVLLAGYIARQAEAEALEKDSVVEANRPANSLHMNSKIESNSELSSEDFSPLIQEWLEALGFDLSAPKTNAFRVIKKLLLKNQPTEKEVKILHSVLQQNVRKLRELSKTD